MEVDLFQKIKRKYGKHSSFAVWDEKDLDDTSAIEKNVSELHGRYVFVGLNAAGRIGVLRNFHTTHRGGRDSWLREALNNNPILRGSYMTDIIVNDFSSRETEVNLSEENIKKNMKRLGVEIDAVRDGNVMIIAFGKRVCKILMENFRGRLMCFLPHYAGRISKSSFLDEVKELSSHLK